MPPRLLTLLAQIETALANNGSSAVLVPPTRTVNFQKGIARMSFADGSGSITLQNFTLADGQICVKAEYRWQHTSKVGSGAIYPLPEYFDWYAAVDRLAEGWLAGVQPLSAMSGSGKEALEAAV